MRAWILWAAAAATALIIAAGCDTTSVSRELGARCERHRDCDERCLADRGQRYPDGLCSLSCDLDRDCPAGSVCADIEGGVCLYACERGADCAFLGAGWQCVREAGRSLRERDEPREVNVCLGE